MQPSVPLSTQMVKRRSDHFRYALCNSTLIFFLCDKVHVHNSSNKNCAQTLISNLRICYSLNLPLVAVVLSEKSCKIHGKIMLCDFLSLISCCSSKKCVTSALFQEIHRATLMKFELYHSRICYGFVFVQGGGWGGVGWGGVWLSYLA